MTTLRTVLTENKSIPSTKNSYKVMNRSKMRNAIWQQIHKRNEAMYNKINRHSDDKARNLNSYDFTSLQARRDLSE